MNNLDDILEKGIDLSDNFNQFKNYVLKQCPDCSEEELRYIWGPDLNNYNYPSGYNYIKPNSETSTNPIKHEPEGYHINYGKSENPLLRNRESYKINKLLNSSRKLIKSAFLGGDGSLGSGYGLYFEEYSDGGFFILTLNGRDIDYVSTKNPTVRDTVNKWIDVYELNLDIPFESFINSSKRIKSDFYDEPTYFISEFKDEMKKAGYDSQTVDNFCITEDLYDEDEVTYSEMRALRIKLDKYNSYNSEPMYASLKRK